MVEASYSRWRLASKGACFSLCGIDHDELRRGFVTAER
jgi:hypothetical protein